MSTVEKKGKCLCGRVEVFAKTVTLNVHACHCNNCRQWSGGPSLSVHCGSEVSFSGEDNITVYQSCDWAELGFCKHCGSHLFYRLIENGEYSLPTGMFDSADGFDLTQQIFIEEKPGVLQFCQ